jgi:hypothetical protein
MTTQYAIELKGLPMWHAVKVASHTSPEVIGLCGHRFTIARRPVTDKPDADSFCAGCLGVQERQEGAQSTSMSRQVPVHHMTHKNQTEANVVRLVSISEPTSTPKPKKEK